MSPACLPHAGIESAEASSSLAPLNHYLPFPILDDYPTDSSIDR